jgi:hypothetical protein
LAIPFGEFGSRLAQLGRIRTRTPEAPTNLGTKLTTTAFPLRWGEDGSMPSKLDVTERWRKLAAEARAVAKQMSDPDAKKIMLEIVKGYERLARRAADREKSSESK